MYKQKQTETHMFRLIGKLIKATIVTVLGFAAIVAVLGLLIANGEPSTKVATAVEASPAELPKVQEVRVEKLVAVNKSIDYDYKNNAHKADMICIAAYSIAKDQTFGVDMDSYRIIVDFQNQLLGKYNYSKQLNTHTNVRKSLLEQRGIEHVAETVKTCVSTQ
jgi:hypothetical protein